MKNADKWTLEEVAGVGHFEIEGSAYDSFIAEKVRQWTLAEVGPAQSE